MAEFASKGWASLNTVLGSIGTAGATGILNNLFGGNANCGENSMVNRYELGLENKISEKDMEIAYLKGQNATDTKFLEFYKYLDGRLNGLEREISDQKVYNATNIATVNCIAGQVNQLFALTKLVIPNGSICPGWGNVTVAPATTTAG